MLLNRSIHVLIPLTGTGVSTFATLNLPSIIDFGTFVYNSGSRDTNITIKNNSNIAGDLLTVEPATFETATGVFQILTQTRIILDPGNSWPIKIRFSPTAQGLHQNTYSRD